MTTFTGITQLPPFGPSNGSAPVGPPPAPPTTPPVGPTVPSTPIQVSSSLVVDLTEASRLAARAVDMIARLPFDDIGSDATKDARIRIYRTNLVVQQRLEQQFSMDGNDAHVVSQLHTADAMLEDANWQLAKKPSPDGRFTGVDIAGAARDTAEGARIINDLLRAAGGVPSEPHIPSQPPSGGGGLPSFPPPQPPATPPSLPPSPPPATPDEPTAPDGPTFPPTQPGGANPPTGGDTEPDSDYPGEDEFPTDDAIRASDG